jgi:hypothetical protein
MFSALQTNKRLLRCHPHFGDPVRKIPPCPLAFQPALFKQPVQGYAGLGKLYGVDPAATTKLLHELPFEVIGYKVVRLIPHFHASSLRMRKSGRRPPNTILSASRLDLSRSAIRLRPAPSITVALSEDF